MPLLEQVLEKNSKDVRLIFKNYPIPNHPLAGPAAMAALAAQEQGKFWEFHNKLFESGDRYTEERIDTIARELSLDMERFNRERIDEKRQKQILQDLQDAAKAGVKGTPSIFVNGRLLKTRSLEGFQEIIDAELAKKGQRRQ